MTKLIKANYEANMMKVYFKCTPFVLTKVMVEQFGH